VLVRDSELADPSTHLQVEGISKSFGPVRALSSMSLSVRSGEVLALLGENGAGKSTLLRVLEGLVQPDEGRITINGEQHTFSGPADAHRAGVRVVNQEPELVPTASVAENLFLNQLPRRRLGVLSWRRILREADSTLEALGFRDRLDPAATVNSLPPGRRQLLEIARSLAANSPVLALDEPTSSLSEQDADHLLLTVERLRDEGVALIYVSHRLRELERIADRIAVMRDGELVGIRNRGEETHDGLVRLMVGRPQLAVERSNRSRPGPARLDVQNLTTAKIRDANLQIAPGEVLGLAGLVGSGRTELARAVAGLDRRESGRIFVDGSPVGARDVAGMIRHGISMTPEDRRHEGFVSTFTIQQNTTLASMSQCRNRSRTISGRKEREATTHWIQTLGIKATGPKQMVTELSGGNQQKVVLARALATEPRVLVLDEPTRGVDVGAKTEIYRLIDQLAQRGMAILFISSELPELLGVADRVAVMRGGEIVGELEGDQATEESVLVLAVGADPETHADSREREIHGAHASPN
jgi:L-arabinose transport system ATP-binding protein